MLCQVVEVYGPGGTGFIMECLTDNRQRATTDIWTIVKKLEGKVCATGSRTDRETPTYSRLFSGSRLEIIKRLREALVCALALRLPTPLSASNTLTA